MIGNLVADKQESITNINWSVYGKIRGIIKRNTTTGKETSTQYGYDPSGNRTYKEVIRRDIGNYSQDIADYTYYVRDAQGNTMATYTKHVEPANSPSLKWSEQHLYGSSRLGVMNLNLDIPAQPMVPQVNQTLADSLHKGHVVYELTNHLGNVMAVISDKKLFSNIVIPETGAAAFYYPEVLSQTDYYAFGQEIKERSYRISGGYQFGFNGKENDGEIKGEGNQQDYGMRIYDPRLGRFLSVDPIAPDYPWYSPYHFAGNSPISFSDLDGLEPRAMYDGWRSNSLKTGTKYWYGDKFGEGWNYRRVVDNDKKIYWVISKNVPGGVIYGESNWHWFDDKTKKWQPFPGGQPYGYSSAKEIANSMKGTDILLLQVFSAALVAPLAVEAGLAGSAAYLTSLGRAEVARRLGGAAAD
ncbi:MAG: RHS repeat domain-containing protein, partial [Chitinophagaceae bacterium]